ncbi:hypothetical protein [Mangrovibacterium diazotrophicum]|uniref:Uncharacterized protein n=1 Tax=Mangrovibacterium diazotrophicum TaxID=1261403 RepID=A0A419W2Y9_9BACT|nr:hypothetical protein [Mangrovibacterium diazotrophicum]RKD89842.1 hypothetical protein BC643_0175 [Mangrovibacterium diazotrophicum]
MKQLKYFLISLLILTSFACKYKCPGFDESEMKWVPYSIGETLKYTNKSDTIELSVVDYYMTEPYSFRGVLIMDVWCEAESYYSTSQADNGYEIREDYSDNSDNWGMNVNITKSDFFKFHIPSQSSLADSIKVAYMQDTLINGFQYSEVFVISKDTANLSPRISYFIKAADLGVIEFYDRKSQQKWNLVNE